MAGGRMPIPLTTEMLAHAYEYLACQPPFSSWNLPPSEDVVFKISRSRHNFAHYQWIGGVHHLVFSRHRVGRHEILITTMAHEMIHLHQELCGIMGDNPHDAAFHRYADRICKLHEFDRMIF